MKFPIIFVVIILPLANGWRHRWINWRSGGEMKKERDKRIKIRCTPKTKFIVWVCLNIEWWVKLRERERKKARISRIEVFLKLHSNTMQVVGDCWYALYHQHRQHHHHHHHPTLMSPISVCTHFASQYVNVYGIWYTMLMYYWSDIHTCIYYLKDVTE